MSRRIWLLVVLGSAMAVGTWYPVVDSARADDEAMGADEKAIRELVAASNAGRPIKQTDDSIYNTGATQRPIIGKDEFEKWMDSERARSLSKERGKTTVKSTVERVVVAESGDLAYEFSRFRMDWEGGEGEPNGFDGSYLRVWRKVEGEWREEAFFARPIGEPRDLPGGR